MSGRVAIPASTTLSSVNADKIQLFSMPGPGSHLGSLWIQFPILDSSNTLRMSLNDGTLVLIANSIYTTWNAELTIFFPVAASTANYFGPAVTYAVDTPIYLSVDTGSGAATAASILYINFLAQIYMD